VSDRVEVNAEPAVLGGLVLVNPGAQGEDQGIRGVDVTDADVEVELLRVRPAWPGRSHPVIDPLEGKGGSAIGVVRADPTSRWGEGGERVVGTDLDRPAQEARVELRQPCRRGSPRRPGPNWE
jgi:hypothetical protein